MLRGLIVLLLVANLAFFGWSRGWLDGVVGLRSIGDREPDRLQRQSHPERIRILPASAAASEASAAVALACFEAGPFTDADIGVAQAAAQYVLPPGSWVATKVEAPGTWLVYMGRYTTRDALTKKEDELKRRRAAYEEINEPAALAPGLSLGRFGDRAAASAALDQFVQQGVRSARVVELTPASTGHMLRVERADPVLATQLMGLKTEALGKGFTACAKPAGG